MIDRRKSPVGALLPVRLRGVNRGSAMASTPPKQQVIYASDGKTVAEIDYFGANGKTVVEVDKYAQGQLQSATRYFADGKTIAELDTYTYSGSHLASVTEWLPLSSERITATLDSSGQIKEVDISALDKSGNIAETDKISPQGLVFEVDRYSNGHLSLTANYDKLGELSTVSSFASDGKTVTEIDTYQYGKTPFHPVSESRADGTGKVFEIDYFDYAGHLVSVSHPGTAPVSTTPSLQPVVSTVPATTITGWSQGAGYGEIDVLKAITAAIGKAAQDVSVPTSIKSQWDLGAVHFQDAWNAGYTGKGVVIADIDTGIDLKNASLTKNLSQYNWNFVNNTSNVQDDNGHGSCTASEMIAANDGRGVTGASYDAQLMVLKALDAKGSGADSTIVAAINYAVAHGANVINLSLGGATPDPTLETALSNASAHGIIVCIAAGNDGSTQPDYPARYAQAIADCIAVGATQASGSGFSMASFSDQAGSTTAYNFVDAPGVGIKGYGLNGAIYSWSGTSMATPLVAAEAADLLSAHTSLTINQIVQDIVHSTVSLVGVPTTTA